MDKSVSGARGSGEWHKIPQEDDDESFRDVPLNVDSQKQSVLLEERKSIRSTIGAGNAVRGQLAFAGAKIAAFFSALGCSIAETAFFVAIKPYELYQMESLHPKGVKGDILEINEDVFEAGKSALQPLNDIGFKLLKREAHQNPTFGEKIAIRSGQVFGSVIGAGLGVLALPFVASFQLLRGAADGLKYIRKQIRSHIEENNNKPQLKFRDSRGMSNYENSEYEEVSLDD